MATVSSDPMTLSTMNQISARRCGLAKERMRRSVALLTVRRRRSPWMALSIAIQWLKSICTSSGCQFNELEVNERAVSFGTLPG